MLPCLCELCPVPEKAVAAARQAQAPGSEAIRAERDAESDFLRERLIVLA